MKKECVIFTRGSSFQVITWTVVIWKENHFVNIHTIQFIFNIANKELLYLFNHENSKDVKALAKIGVDSLGVPCTPSFIASKIMNTYSKVTLLNKSSQVS